MSHGEIALCSSLHLFAYLDYFQFFSVANSAAIRVLVVDLTWLLSIPWEHVRGSGTVRVHAGAFSTLPGIAKLLSKVTLAICSPNSSIEECDFLTCFPMLDIPRIVFSIPDSVGYKWCACVILIAASSFWLEEVIAGWVEV